MRNRMILAAALAALAVPAAAWAASAVGQGESRAWRQVATEQDRARLRDWRSTWVEGLKAARRKFGNEVEQAGALLDPDGALLQPEPPAGEYRCRTIKIGGQDGAMFDWIAYPEFRCRISREGGVLSFVRTGGSQRPVGRIYPDGVRRMIFLGSLQLGDERQVLPYGADERRDLAGILERVEDKRWRLVFPRPAFESIIDVIELVPA
jgi:hypothetical protein